MELSTLAEAIEVLKRLLEATSKNESCRVIVPGASGYVLAKAIQATLSEAVNLTFNYVPFGGQSDIATKRWRTLNGTTIVKDLNKFNLFYQGEGADTVEHISSCISGVKSGERIIILDYLATGRSGAAFYDLVKHIFPSNTIEFWGNKVVDFVDVRTVKLPNDVAAALEYLGQYGDTRFGRKAPHTQIKNGKLVNDGTDEKESKEQLALYNENFSKLKDLLKTKAKEGVQEIRMAQGQR